MSSPMFTLTPTPLLKPKLDCQPAVPPGQAEKHTLPNVGNPGKGNDIHAVPGPVGYYRGYPKIRTSQFYS